MDLIELLALSDKSKLLDAHFDKNGNISCKWQVDAAPTHSIEAHVSLSKMFGYMPSRAAFYALMADEKGVRSRRRLISEVRSKWERRGGLFVPSEIVADDLGGNAGAIEHHYEMSFQWKVGGELPVTFEIQPELRDWREPIRETFGLQW